MAIGVGFRPLKGRYLKAQQFTEDLWLDGKSILARMLLRARKRPARGSTNRTKCSKMEQLAPPFQLSITSCLAIFPRLQFATRPPRSSRSVFTFYLRRLVFRIAFILIYRFVGCPPGYLPIWASIHGWVSPVGTSVRLIFGAWAFDPSVS